MSNPQPPQFQKKITAGVCGRAGCGKTAFSRFLKETAEGYKVDSILLEADTIAKEFYSLEDVKSKVVKEFGDQTYDSSGNLDRTNLARIVFSDFCKLERLNSIIHPLLLLELDRRIDSFTGNLVVIDAALLLDWPLADRCDLLIAITADLQTCIERLKVKGLDRKRAENILASQRPEKDFMERCRIVVENDEGLSTLRKSAESVFRNSILPLMTD